MSLSSLAHAQLTVVNACAAFFTIDGSPRGARPIALAVAPTLVGGKVKGFVATQGTDRDRPGQVYPFRIDAPLPLCSGSGWTGLVLSVGIAGGGSLFVPGLSSKNYLPKLFGVQGAWVEPQLSFFSVSHLYPPNPSDPLIPWHMVSVVDTANDTFNAPGDDQDIALLDPDDPNDPNDPYSGKVPEGLGSITTSVNGVRHRTALAQAYHEGTLGFIDWSSVTQVNVEREFEIDRTYPPPGGVSIYLGLDPDVDPYGNLNRAVAVAQNVPTGPNAGRRFCFATLNFDPCPDPEPQSGPPGPGCLGHDTDTDPDEGAHDYVVTIDLTQYPSSSPGFVPPVGHTVLNPIAYADQGTPSALAVGPDQDRLYVLSKRQPPFHSGVQNETPWLYVLDITQGPPHPITYSKALHELLGLQNSGHLRPSSGRLLAVRNSNLTTGPVDRLYIPTNRPTGQGPVSADDGVLIVLDITNRDLPALYHILEFDGPTPGKHRDVIDISGLPISGSILGNGVGMARNVVLAARFDSTDMSDSGHIALAEDL